MSPANPWVLTGTAGELAGRKIELDEGKTTLGRTSHNKISIPDVNISRTHVTFYLEGDHVFIKDEDSRNGVFINQNKITSGRKLGLKSGDVIQIGIHTFVLERNAPPKPTSAAAPDTSGAYHEFRSKNRDRGLQLKNIISKFAANRRTGLYLLVGIVILIVALTQLSPTPKKQKSAPPAPEVSVKSNASTTKYSDEQLENMKIKAKAALQFQEYLAATLLYEKIVQADPKDEVAKTQYLFARNQLKKNIEEHLEYAKQEYEKLNYERAIIEWKQVLALTFELNPEIYKQTQQKISDVEKELQKRK